MTTKKREYEKPSLEVVVMKQQQSMLQASAEVTATMNDTWTEHDI
jgi:hypothetical protein